MREGPGPGRLPFGQDEQDLQDGEDFHHREHREHRGGTGKERLTTKYTLARLWRETHERESRGGLEEIARRYLLQPVGGFPWRIARVSLANRRVQSPSQRCWANASSIAHRLGRGERESHANGVATRQGRQASRTAAPHAGNRGSCLKLSTVSWEG